MNIEDKYQELVNKLLEYIENGKILDKEHLISFLDLACTAYKTQETLFNLGREDMKNNIIKNALKSLFEQYLTRDEIYVGNSDYILDYDYRKLSKAEVKKMLNTELADVLTEYGIMNFEAGFQAGVDTILKLQGKDSIFGILDEFEGGLQ